MPKKNQLPPDHPSYANQSAFRIMERALKRTSLVEEGLSLPHVLSLDSTDSPSFSLPSSPFLTPDAQPYSFKDIPGLILIKKAIPVQIQSQIAINSLRKYAKYPNVNNLESHFIMPQEGIWNAFVQIKSGIATADRLLPRTFHDTPPVLAYPVTNPENDHNPPKVIIDPPTNPKSSHKPSSITDTFLRLRWVTLGYQYNWTTKEYHLNRQPPFPQFIAQITNDIITSVQEFTHYPLSRWAPEAGIINFYQPGDMLMAHQDRSEKSMEPPLISLSIGLSAILLIGSETRESQPTGILLESGDVLVMSGASRRFFHGIPKVYPQTTPKELLDQVRLDLFQNKNDLESDIMTEYLSHTRLNLNVRQVIPKPA